MAPSPTLSAAPRFSDCLHGARTHQTQIAIIGGGLSGSLAAVILGRSGYRVTLIDRTIDYPDEFRAEKISGDQVSLLQRIGLLQSIASASTPFARSLNIRRGEVLDRTDQQHFGIRYKDLVEAVRAQLPASVRFTVGRVINAQTGPEHQLITLQDGGTIEARLAVLATGLAPLLCGISRGVVAAKQSMAFGFDLEPGPGQNSSFPAFTFYGEHGRDAIDYLSVFPIGCVTRANLFTFHQLRDPWIRQLRLDPKTALVNALPNIRRYFGDFKVSSKVRSWVMDLSIANDYRRDGIALIGDAFQTSCPAAGVGVSRLFMDVYQLCKIYVPRWFATPGMGVEKINQFYDDPIKRQADERAQRLSAYRRSLSLDTSVSWRMHRSSIYLRRRTLCWINDQERMAAQWLQNIIGSPVAGGLPTNSSDERASQ